MTQQYNLASKVNLYTTSTEAWKWTLNATLTSNIVLVNARPGPLPLL
jgi:hypothetical protein